MDFDIVQLAELLNPTKDSDSESDEEKDIRADRKDSGKAEGKPNPYAKVEIDRKVQEDRDNADDSCKIVDDLGWELASDWQKTPEWNLSYKQQVTASDVFLGVCKTHFLSANYLKIVFTFMHIEKTILPNFTSKFYLCFGFLFSKLKLF